MVLLAFASGAACLCEVLGETKGGGGRAGQLTNFSETPRLVLVVLMEEILHHLGCINPVNNGMNHQHQLVSRISSINSIMLV